MALPTDAKERKNVPMARGLLDYFPDALAAVADVSRVGNDQHNPGQPMHWAKHLSTDHADCLIRHLVDRGRLDSDGLRHTAKVAWRALALLQTELEAEQESTRLADAFAAGVEPVGSRENVERGHAAISALRPCTASTSSFDPDKWRYVVDDLILEAAGVGKVARPDQDSTGGFDVCCDQPLHSWAHCEGCHSMVCEQTGHCMNHLKAPH